MNDLIDCHSHLLYDLDDGSKSLEESISILQDLHDLGFSSVILTPHFDRTYRPSLVERQDKFTKLRRAASKLGMKLYLATEVHLTDDIMEHLPEFSTIGSYIFLEFSLTNKRANFVKYLRDLDFAGYHIVLVHPERYHYFELKDYRELYDYGLKFQLNYGSICGLYGADAKKKAKYLLENHMVDLLGTDIHFSTPKIRNTIKKAIKKISRLVGPAEFADLASRNALALLNHLSDVPTTKSPRTTMRSADTAIVPKPGKPLSPTRTSSARPKVLSLTNGTSAAALRPTRPSAPAAPKSRPAQLRKSTPLRKELSVKSIDSPAKPASSALQKSKVVAVNKAKPRSPKQLKSQSIDPVSYRRRKKIS